MHKRYRTIIGIVAIVVFGAIGIWSLVDTATPYVGFNKARAMKSKVQVFGKIDFNSANYDEKTGLLSFDITDEEGDRMKVTYDGIKPGNFEQAESVVCIGAFNDDIFKADNLLVKCPSKYQGTENQKQSDNQAKGL